MLSDVRNWVFGGTFAATLVIFFIVLLHVKENAIADRDNQWRGEITARNIKYHNDMMLKDAKVRRREEEIYEQLELRRQAVEENERLLAKFAETIPLSEACNVCRIPRSAVDVPAESLRAGASSSPPAPETGGGKGGAAKPAGKAPAVPKRR